MQKEAKIQNRIYTAYKIGIDHADFEVTTPGGDFIKSFSVQTIGDPRFPEPDYSGVSHLNQNDVLAIEAVLPNYPIAELRECL